MGPSVRGVGGPGTGLMASTREEAQALLARTGGQPQSPSPFTQTLAGPGRPAGAS